MGTLLDLSGRFRRSGLLARLGAGAA